MHENDVIDYTYLSVNSSPMCIMYVFNVHTYVYINLLVIFLIAGANRSVHW